jgi:hypothetical protein
MQQFQLFSMFARRNELCVVLFLCIFACLGNLEICRYHFHKRNILMYENSNYSWHEIHLSSHLMVFNRITKACLNLQGRRFEHRPLCVLAVVGQMISLCSDSSMPTSTSANRLLAELWAFNMAFKLAGPMFLKPDTYRSVTQNQTNVYKLFPVWNY